MPVPLVVSKVNEHVAHTHVTLLLSLLLWAHWVRGVTVVSDSRYVEVLVFVEHFFGQLQG